MSHESGADEANDGPTIRYRKSVGGLLLELLMIGVAVFLGASAETWRESRHHKELATASLRNFRREVADNRSRVQAGRDYHVALEKRVAEFIDGHGPRSLQSFLKVTEFRGTRTVDFEHTAWDLALATQALSDIKPDLAYAISHVYSVQQAFASLQLAFMTGAFAPASFANMQDASGLAVAMVSFLGDVNIQEPRLVRLYDRLLPQIDSALGGPPKVDSAKKK